MKLRYIICAILCFVLADSSFGVEYPYTIKGENGYSAVIKNKPQRIAVGGVWPLPPILMMFENSAKHIIYMPRATKNALKHTFMNDMFSEIAHIQAGENENIEELLRLKPDLFICHSATIKVCEAMKTSGVPTIEVSVNKWNYNSYKTLKGWFDTLKPLLDEAKAKAVLGFVKNTQDSIKSRVKTALKTHKKPTALFIHNYENQKSFSVGGIFGNYLCEVSGCQNVIDSKSTAKISLEELYKLNPDIIYLNNFNTLMPKDVLDSKLWQPLNAVQQKRVYKFPLGTYRPFAPGLDLPILLEWLYMHNFPQFLDESALINFAREYYAKYFGVKLNNKQLKAIFNPKKEAGKIK